MNKQAPSGRIYIAGEGGNLYLYDFQTDTLSRLGIDMPGRSETLMGLVRHNGRLFVGAKTRIYGMGKDGIQSDCFSPRPDFHQMDVFDGCLYTTCTAINEVWKFNMNLDLLAKHKVDPPIKERPVGYKVNYNHLNNIFRHEGRYYVCLNWLTEKQYGPSGVAVLDEDMNELERFEYGWELHAFCIIGGSRFAICGSSGGHAKVNHPHRSGLMVDGSFAFEHDPVVFCKDFCMDEGHIYIVGGDSSEREMRHKAHGTLYVLDRHFNKLFERKFDRTGGFCGCLLAPDTLSVSASEVPD